MAGLTTEVCLAQTVLGALKDGFEVYFLSDRSAGITKEGHEDAKVLHAAGRREAVELGIVVSESAPDYTSPARSALTEVMLRHGGAPRSLLRRINRHRSRYRAVGVSRATPPALALGRVRRQRSQADFRSPQANSLDCIHW
jgi:Isochorismatase family